MCPQCRTRLVQQYPGEDLHLEQLRVGYSLLQISPIRPNGCTFCCQALKRAQIPFRHGDLNTEDWSRPFLAEGFGRGAVRKAGMSSRAQIAEANGGPAELIKTKRSLTGRII